MLETLFLAQMGGGARMLVLALPVLFLLFLLFIAAVVAIGLLIKHRRWGVLAVGAAVLFSPIVLMVAVRAYSLAGVAHNTVVYGRNDPSLVIGDFPAPAPPIPPRAMQVFPLGEHSRTVTVSNEPRDAEDAEDAARAAMAIDVSEDETTQSTDDSEAAPSEEVTEDTTAEETTAETAPETPSEPEEPTNEARPTRPAWVTAEPDANQKVIQVDPRELLAESRLEATIALARWGWLAAGGDPEAPMSRQQMEQIADRLRVDDGEHIETRDVAGGEVYRVWWLGQIDDEDRKWLAGSVAQWERASRQTTGVRNLAAGGVGAVTLVALLHGVLRMGATKPDEPTE